MYDPIEFDVSEFPVAVVEELTRNIDIAAGVLDKILPDWASLVDFDKLNMGSFRYCILGQVFGEFSDGLDRFRTGLREEGLDTFGGSTAVVYGFAAGWSDAGEGVYVTDTLLSHLWFARIKGNAPTMRDRLLMGARSMVVRFERQASEAESAVSTLTADVERMIKDHEDRIASYEKRIADAKVRAERARQVTTEAQEAFDALAQS